MKFLHSLLLCCMTHFAYAQMTSLLIMYQAGNQFTAEELAQEIDAHLIKIQDMTKTEIEIAYELYDEIGRFNRESDRHIIIDMSQSTAINRDMKIRQFAAWVGCDYIIIADQELTEATLAITEKERDIYLVADALRLYHRYYHQVQHGYL